MDQLEICLFGSLQLKRGELPLMNFGSNKVRALITYLVVESRYPHQRRKLGSLLWPDLPENTALSNLRYALSNLRKAIGDHSAQPAYLIISPQTIQFNNEANLRVDVAQFEEACKLARQNPLDFPSLLRAAELYQGRFLAGFSIPDSIPFEEWMVLKRERYDRLAYQVFHRLANYYELIGDYERALSFAQRQIELDLWREEVHRLIMRCLYFSGQRSAAVGQYETCCKALESDLGIEPNPDTQALFEAIRANRLPVPPSPPAFFLRSPSLQQEQPDFVDRQEPLDRLHAALDRAMAGHGQMFLISGSAGQGKTVLVKEFVQQALKSHTNLAAAWGNSQAYFGSGDPFLPFREILEMLTGKVEHRWEAGVITHDHACRMWHLTETVTKALVHHGPELIGSFLSGPALHQRVSYVLREETPWLFQLSNIIDQKSERNPFSREDLIQQYSRVVIEVSHHVPLLIFIDDLQWADQSSLELFFHLSRHLTNAQILLIGALRPDQNKIKSDSISLSLVNMVNELKLERGDILIDLDKQMDRSFIDEYLDQDLNHLGEDFRDTLFKYTQAHPLYTAEMLFDMKEKGSLVKDEEGAWVTSDNLNWDHLPSRVEAAIEERLSHLPDDLFEMLKTASVEGERFTAEVLSDVEAIDGEFVLTRIRDELDRYFNLVKADSSRKIDGKRLTRYRFRHILFQKYLYKQLDAIERAELHERVGKAVEDCYSGNLEEMYVPLAVHFELAGLIDKAIRYYDLAGTRANQFSAYEEAIHHFKKALCLLEEEPETMDRIKQEFDLLLRMSAPLMLARGFASEDMGNISDRMAALLKCIPLKVEMFPLFHAISAYYEMRAQHNKALDLLQQAEGFANRSENELLIHIVDWGHGFTFLWLGKFEEALVNLEKMVNFYDPQKHRELRQSYGMDPGVGSNLWSSWALWLLGFPEGALKRGQQAIDLSIFLNDPGNQMFALDITGYLQLFIGEMKTISDLLHSFEVLLRKCPSPIHSADLEFLKGFYNFKNGGLEMGIAQMERGADAFQACGTRSQLSLRKTILAEALIQNNQWDIAEKTIQEIEDLVEETGEVFYQAETLRVKGLLMEKTGRLKEAEHCFFESLKLARVQKAKTFELRAATSLGRLWKGQGRKKEAHQFLAEVYNWFTEGLDSADLIAAQALLDELEQCQ